MDMKLINYFMLAISGPILLALGVLLLRFTNKYRALPAGEERRKNPKLRSVINIMMALLIIVAIVAAAALILFIYTGYMLAKG